jgi:DegV family protein with EDD domain
MEAKGGPMRRVAVVTDSAANLPAQLVDRYSIRVVPLQALRTNPDDLPASSSPSEGEFLRAYSELAREADAMVSIHIAAEFSATFAAAQQARDLLQDLRIALVDSRTATMGCGFVALAAARAAAKGKDLPRVLQAAHAVIDSVRVYGVLDSLRYVQRSGRVPAIAAIAGSLLDIHPLLYIKDGQAGLLAIQRTKRRALRRLLDVVEAKAAGQPLRAAVMHADAAQDAALLCKELNRRCDCRELLETEFTPLIGSYAGPGIVAVAFHPEAA